MVNRAPVRIRAAGSELNDSVEIFSTIRTILDVLARQVSRSSCWEPGIVSRSPRSTCCLVSRPDPHAL